ncbi:MAG TPA: ethyl tert-butyl ether degradation protein EthD [Rhodobacteraceae bacterium]|nr:ethyl tert-butyl ether degradation protein EthD [Paracoccaceae bacterium]
MIHQHIFAAPKPGMTEAEFQDYWLHKHAVNYASKIKQIKRYKIDLRLPFSRDPAPLWNAAAEIWLNDEADQIASLQSPEFIDGARRDEPNWAAFWKTLGLDCDTESLKPGAVPDGAVKLLILLKRAEGVSRDAFRTAQRAAMVDAAADPAILRLDLAFARDALYAVGGPPFDGLGHVWFASVEAAETALAGPTGQALLPETSDVLRTDQFFPMLTSEHWVIGPELRP